jgi:hypothetical protein
MIEMRIPAEFLGLARQLRERVQHADDAVNAELAHIVAPLQRRLARKPALRPDTAIDAARSWQRMTAGEQFRLAFDATTDDKQALVITEVRVNGIRLLDHQWNRPEWESGVGIVQVKLTTSCKLKLTVTPLVVLSLHAMGRWFERSGRRDYCSLLRDIVPLLAATATDRISANNGDWLGSVTVAHGDQGGRNFVVRSVRTFVPTPILASQPRPAALQTQPAAATV